MAGKTPMGIEFYEAGDPCPECGTAMEERPRMFALREAGVMPGIVCPEGCGLYSSEPWAMALEQRIRRRGYEAFPQRAEEG